MRQTSGPVRRGVAAIVMIVLLLVVDLIALGMVLGGARDQDLTVRRLETVQAFYAAEAGMNMAVREIMLDADEDGDGTTGSISDDDDDANDPGFGAARVRVTKAPDAGGTTHEPAQVQARAQARTWRGAARQRPRGRVRRSGRVQQDHRPAPAPDGAGRCRARPGCAAQGCGSRQGADRDRSAQPR